MFTRYLLVRPELIRVYIIQVDNEEFYEDPSCQLNADARRRKSGKENLISALNKNLVMYNSINTVCSHDFMTHQINCLKPVGDRALVTLQVPMNYHSF